MLRHCLRSLLSISQSGSLFGSGGVYRGLAAASKKKSKPKTQTKSKMTKKKPQKKKKPQAQPKITDPRIETKLNMCLQLMEDSMASQTTNTDASDIHTGSNMETSTITPMAVSQSASDDVDAQSTKPFMTAEEVEEGAQRAKEYSRKKMQQHRDWQSDMSMKQWMTRSAIRSLPLHLREAAAKEDTTPIPMRLPFPTDTPPKEWI